LRVWASGFRNFRVQGLLHNLVRVEGVDLPSAVGARAAVAPAQRARVDYLAAEDARHAVAPEARLGGKPSVIKWPNTTASRHMERGDAIRRAQRFQIPAPNTMIWWASDRLREGYQDAQGTHTRSHISPSILVYEEKNAFSTDRTQHGHLVFPSVKAVHD